MRGFSIAFVWLQNVSNAPLSKLSKFVILLLTFPCFEASHFCFKRAYLLQQRRLRLLSSQNAFLKFYDGAIPRYGVVNILQSLREIEGRLESAKSNNRFGYHSRPPSARC